MEVLAHSLVTDMDVVEWTVADSNDSTDCEIKPKRKRQRLDHLSHEEKLMRRKLKNRMAAQSARDRKKVKMQDLEEEVILITKQRNALLNQNESLKQKNALLEQQNKELKQRLSSISVKAEVGVGEPVETIESAELISEPQQQDQVSIPVTPMSSTAQSITRLAFWLILQNLMLFSMSSLSTHKSCSTQPKTSIKAYNCRQMMALNTNNLLPQKRQHIWDQLKT